MVQSLTEDWLYENSERSYPLVDSPYKTAGDGYVLTNGVILDALIGYDSLSGDPALSVIHVSGTTVTFTITGYGTIPLDTSTVTSWPHAIRSDYVLLVLGQDTASIPNGTHTFNSGTGIMFEPSVCYETGGAWGGVEYITIPGPTSLTGVVGLLEGYQFGLTATTNSVDMEVGKILGDPVICQTFNSTNDCDSIISFINGAGGDTNHVIHLVAGYNAVVYDDPANHRIFIGLSFSSSDLCSVIPPNTL